MANDPQSRPADSAAEVWTLGRLLAWTADFFAQNGLDEPRLASEILLAHAAHCRRIDLYTRFEQTATPDLLTRYRELVKRAAAHEPIAYLVGEKEFFSLLFLVSSAVLIPRPETESIIEAALDLIAGHKIEPDQSHQDTADSQASSCANDAPSQGSPSPRSPTILDLGTGSGCIAVTLAVQVKSAAIVASDRSPEALEVARRNAERHGVADRVRLIEADGFQLPGDAVPPGGFDLLVSNPPYVAADEISQLEKTVRDFEPIEALTDNADGLSFYRLIATEAPKYLQPTGRVIVEVADAHAPAVIKTICGADAFVYEKTMKDQVTRRDRAVVFRRKQ